MKRPKWEKEWKKLVKVNFDELGGKAYGRGLTEMKVEVLGLFFISRHINSILDELEMEPTFTAKESNALYYEEGFNEAVAELNKKIAKIRKEYR